MAERARHAAVKSVLGRAGDPNSTLESSGAADGDHVGTLLDVHAISKTFEGPGGPIEALSTVSLSVQAGEFVSVVGPSGCGKSTLLEIICGLQIPSSGYVLVDGAESATRVGSVGYMPQKDLLLPWRSVLDNTILGLEIAGCSRSQARREAVRWFALFGLQGFEAQYPAILSGGMRQRAALLRTFLAGGDVLLLDEPFGALDALTRARMQAWLLDVRHAFQKTIVLVTHDIDEALFLSDRVLIMSPRPGRISETFDVPFRRPRVYDEVVTSPSFAALKRMLLRSLQGGDS